MDPKYFYLKYDKKILYRNTSGRITFNKTRDIFALFLLKPTGFNPSHPRYYFCSNLGTVQCISAGNSEYTSEKDKWTLIAIKAHPKQ
jgi:hypothetical protein